ncbi:MAG: DUF975 family protein [Oscillospiraceae bacterium]|nr:DUF975 family protein [Oscillospiraceae bacterium]
MDIRDRRALKQRGTQALAAVPGDPGKLVLLYAGGTAVLALVCSLLSHAVGLKIENTGGLSNMGLRSILSTVQAVLPLVNAIVTLLLGYGYRYASLRMARQQYCQPATLLEGFRRFGPLLRMVLIQGLIYMAIAFISSYIGSMIFVMTPLANDFLELMLPIVNSASMLTEQIMLDEATLMAATKTMLWAIPIMAGLFVLLATPIMYQYRMAVYSLFDAPEKGAMAALRESRGMMKGNRMELFKLDVSFWWFYALEVLISVLAYGDVLLPMAGVSFPWSDTVSYYLFYAVSLAAQVGMYYLFLNRVNVTYATVYEVLKPEPQEPQKVALGNIFDLARDYQD